jgi:hypothetical protein
MKHFIGAPANRRAQMAVVWSVGLPHEAVGELVANERLRAVIQVREQHLSRRHAWRDGAVLRSTSSTIHRSELNTSASSSGAEWPISPSVDPKPLTTGVRNASAMTARTSGIRVSHAERCHSRLA